MHMGIQSCYKLCKGSELERNSHYAGFLRFITSTITICNTIITNIKYGYNFRLIKSLNNPNNGGTRVVPIYAHAIWTPMIACDFSGPKFSGVSCKRDGYIGAHPTPIINIPGIETKVGSGSIINKQPRTTIPCPIRTMILSPALFAKNPHTNLPNVIPI